MEWQYLQGTLASVAYATVIQPTTEHAVELEIDTKRFDLVKRTIPIQHDIVMPAASESSPSVFKFRLELLYRFTSQDMRHSASDWNILFNVVIRTTDGQQIPLFIDQRWRT